MKVSFFTYEMYHNRKNIGSTKLRVHNLIKYWPEASIYQYGQNPDVMVFQKVYCTPDYKFPAHFEGIKILDICDPDWMELGYIKETIDAVDAVTCPTQPLADFLSQLTDKPVRVIPDRHDLEPVPKQPKQHRKTNPVKLVWFGYGPNADTLKEAVRYSLVKEPVELTIIADNDPTVWRWANDSDFKKRCHFVQHTGNDALYEILQQSDIALLPRGNRPQDRFKSNNKTIISYLAGLPVATNGDELRRLYDAKMRQIEADKNFHYAKANYGCKISVAEMQELISELQKSKVNTSVLTA